MFMVHRCDTCGGKGKIIRSKCPVCNGKKVLRGNEQLTIIVEKGQVDDGTIVSNLNYYTKLFFVWKR
jgi:DnaJ-class molecular chaperone